MKKISKKTGLFCMSMIVLILFINSVYANIYYNFDAYYENGKIKVQDKGVIFSQQELSDNLGGNIFEIKDFKDNTIEEGNFIIPNKIAYDKANSSGDVNEGGVIELNNVSFELYVPYYDNAKEIRFYDENKNEIEKIDIAKYAKDKTAEGSDATDENLLGNDKDEHGCIGSAGYSWCEEKQKCLRVWEEKCETETIENNLNNFVEKLKNWNYLIMGLIIVLIILIAIFLFYPKKKNKK